jgi:hypothetical protein
MGTVSGVSYASAHVTGEVNAGGFAFWSFQYSTDAVNWTGANQELSFSETPEPVSLDIAGLKGATKYFVRLTATNFGDPEAISPGPDPEFETLPVDPPSVLGTDDATDVAYTTAKASGEVERPLGNSDHAFDVSCRFEYVTQAQFEASGFESPGQAPCEQNPIEAEGAKAITANLSGLSVATTYHLRLTAENAGGTDAKEASSTFTTLTPVAPTVSSLAVSEIAGTSAHFSAKVNPNGSDPAFDSSWHFQCTPSCGAPGATVTADGSEHVVSADVSGLEPNTDYQVELIASNQGGQGEAGPVAFKTSTLPPFVQTGFATDVEADSATVAGKVNPHNSPTTYQFEYGLDESYGTAVPVPAASLGAIDNVNHQVAQQLAGLQEDSIYHFRLSATNTESDETSHGADHTFVTPSVSGPKQCLNQQLRAENSSLALPDCRAYEMVSPVRKNGNDAGAHKGIPSSYSLATADGNGVLYGTLGPQGTAHRGLQSYAVSRRGTAGWSSVSAIPGGSSDRIFAISYAPYDLIPSSDLSKILFGAQASFVPDNPITLSSSSALYMGHEDGSVDWLTRPQVQDPQPPPGSLPQLAAFVPVGASPDLSTVYFFAGPTLLPEDAARASGSGWGLYEYGGGELKPAGTLPNGSQSPGGAAPAAGEGTNRGGFNFTDPEMTANQVSRDGSTLFFVSPDPGPNPVQGPIPQLYVRRGGESTLVSHAADGKAAPSGAAPVGALNSSYQDQFAHVYAYGSPDGDSAIFQSKDALAPGAPGDSSLKAYRYDVEADTVTYLPGVGGNTVVAASDDGGRFLFGGANRIGVWDQGAIKTIASLNLLPNHHLAPARATASGSVFLFTTDVAIPGFNSGGGFNQVYRYEVAQEQLTCLSCPPDDVVPSENASLANQDAVGYMPSGETVPNRGLSADAGRVFFDTPDPLVPEDTNGVRDVYEWTPSGPSLISSGQNPQSSFFLDNGADGGDVFFTTSEGLDPRDTDGAYDVYDARVGGGFAQAAAVSRCVGNDVCRDAAAAPPDQPGPATSSFSGKSEQPGTPKNAKLEVAGHQVVGGVPKLKLTLPKPGTVAASGKGLKSTHHTYPKAGTYQLKLALKPASRKALREKHRLKLKVHLRFSPSSGKPSSADVVLTVKG